MAVDPNKPQAQDILADSQADIQGNFQGYNTVFGVNHVDFADTSSDKGKHKWVDFVQQAAAPASTTTDFLMYNKDASGSPELFGKVGATEFQMTKGGSLYLGCIPAVAVNFRGSDGAIQGTALNCSSVAVAASIYTVNFATALSDNNYFFSVSGFGNTGTTPVISQVVNNTTYGNSADTTFLKVYFRNDVGTLITPVRASVIIWRFQ